MYSIMLLDASLTWNGLESSVVRHLVSPHVGQAVLHTLGPPEKVEHSEILEHRL